MEVTIDAVTKENINDYIAVGIQSYKEHYLHLWQNNDPTPFIDAYLKKEPILKALKDPKQLFYLIKAGTSNVGILNLTFDLEQEKNIPKRNLLLNKIYLLKSYSGMGIGSKTLEFVYDLGKKYQKKVLWLYAMKKGKPLNFYKNHGFDVLKEAFIHLPHVLDEEKEMWLMVKKL